MQHLFFVVIVFYLLHVSIAFTVSNGRSSSVSSTSRLWSTLRLQSREGTITSGLISNLAEFALKLRLRRQTSVTCDVTTPSSGSEFFLRGVVGPVTVKGSGWQSPLGLSCQTIEATVDTCQLDVGKILRDRKLTLTKPAQGRATAVLDANDFDSFLTHPNVRPPTISPKNFSPMTTLSSSSISFLRGKTVVTDKETVIFFATYEEYPWKFILSRSSQTLQSDAPVVVKAIPTRTFQQEHPQDWNIVSGELSTAMTKFFVNLVLELDGTFLTFENMSFCDGGEGQLPSVKLDLKITVRKFPSPGLAF
jgi:hypothetical protein